MGDLKKSLVRLEAKLLKRAIAERRSRRFSKTHQRRRKSKVEPAVKQKAKPKKVKPKVKPKNTKPKAKPKKSKPKAKTGKQAKRKSKPPKKRKARKSKRKYFGTPRLYDDYENPHCCSATCVVLLLALLTVLVLGVFTFFALKSTGRLDKLFSKFDKKGAKGDPKDAKGEPKDKQGAKDKAKDDKRAKDEPKGVKSEPKEEDDIEAAKKLPMWNSKSYWFLHAFVPLVAGLTVLVIVLVISIALVGNCSCAFVGRQTNDPCW